jgi:hypothetical protein
MVKKQAICRPEAKSVNGKRFRGTAVFILVISLWFSACSLEDIFNDSSSTGGLSESEIVAGLKEALEVGIDSASSQLHKVGGYLLHEVIAIVLPDDVKAALGYVETVEQIMNDMDPLVLLSFESVSSYAGFDFNKIWEMGDGLRVALNRAAEEAADTSAPIFKDAIFSMTIQDAIGILQGDSTEATDYLKEKTLKPLTEAYTPIVNSWLDKVDANYYWSEFTSLYNDFVELYSDLKTFSQLSPDLVQQLNSFNPQPLTTDLGKYTTEWALWGLFYVVGEEETRIRLDPIARVTELLKKVFGTLDD